MARKPPPMVSTIETGGTSPPNIKSPEQSSFPGVKYTAGVDPTQRYISGFPYYTVPYPRALPYFIDPLESDFGLDIYTRMMLDPVVESSVNALRLGALSNPPRLISKDPKNDDANTIKDFCQRLLDSVDFYGISWQMLDALVYGHKISEVTFKWGEDPIAPGGGQVWDEIEVKPKTSAVPVVDPFMRHIGYRALTPGQAFPVLQGTYIINPQEDPQFLIRQKCGILTNRPVDNDPRGSSQLRSSYNAWYVKGNSWPQVLQFLASYALPIPVGETAPDADVRPAVNPDGSVQVDSDGNIIRFTPEQALAVALSAISSGAPIVVPSGAKVTQLTVTGNGEAIKVIINELCDNQIRYGIMGNTLTGATEGSGPSGSSKVHQDTKGDYISYIRFILAKCWQQEYFKVAVQINFGKEALQYLPDFTLSAVEDQDQPTVWSALGSLGLKLQKEQFPEVMTQVGLPPLPDGWTEKALKRDAAEERAKLLNPQPPMYSGQIPESDIGAVTFDNAGDWVMINGKPVHISRLGTVHKTPQEFVNNSVHDTTYKEKHAWISRDGRVIDAGKSHFQSAKSLGAYVDDVLDSGVVRVMLGKDGKMQVESSAPVSLPQLRSVKRLQYLEGMPTLAHDVNHNEKTTSGSGAYDTSEYEADLRRVGHHPAQQTSMFDEKGVHHIGLNEESSAFSFIGRLFK